MNIACSRTPPLDSFVRPPFPVRRRTVAEYEELTRRGLLTAVDKVELLEGWIVPKMTRNPPHSSTIQCLIDELCQFLRTRWKLRIQSATCTADSVPEPDVAVVAGPAGRIDNQNATVVEVADATLRQEVFARCVNDPGGLGQTPDCVNAREAERMESHGSLRDQGPVGLDSSGRR